LVSDIPAGDGKIVNLFYSVDTNILMLSLSPTHNGYEVAMGGRFILADFQVNIFELFRPEGSLERLER
jgi:hypothetical protein